MSCNIRLFSESPASLPWKFWICQFLKINLSLGTWMGAREDRWIDRYSLGSVSLENLTKVTRQHQSNLMLYKDTYIQLWQHILLLSFRKLSAIVLLVYSLDLVRADKYQKLLLQTLTTKKKCANFMLVEKRKCDLNSVFNANNTW